MTKQEKMIYHSKVIDWAKDKGLLKEKSIIPQFKKLFEETAELVSAIIKGNIDDEIDAFGDVQVVLIIFCEQLGIDYPVFERNPEKNKGELELFLISELGDISDCLIRFKGKIGYGIERDISDLYQYFCYLAEQREKDLNKCLSISWNEIKDRKGKNVNGTFVKDGK